MIPLLLYINTCLCLFEYVNWCAYCKEMQRNPNRTIWGSGVYSDLNFPLHAFSLQACVTFRVNGEVISFFKHSGYVQPSHAMTWPQWLFADVCCRIKELAPLLYPSSHLCTCHVTEVPPTDRRVSLGLLTLGSVLDFFWSVECGWKWQLSVLSVSLKGHPVWALVLLPLLWKGNTLFSPLVPEGWGHMEQSSIQSATESHQPIDMWEIHICCNRSHRFCDYLFKSSSCLVQCCWTVLHVLRSNEKGEA